MHSSHSGRSGKLIRQPKHSVRWFSSVRMNQSVSQIASLKVIKGGTELILLYVEMHHITVEDIDYFCHLSA